MTKDKDVEESRTIMLENARQAQKAAREISKQTRSLYTDGYHKKMTTLVAMLNSSNQAAKGILMAHVIQFRIQNIGDVARAIEGK